MGKNENISFSVPDAPPGFPLLNNSKAASSPAVEEIRSGHMHAQNHDSNSTREQPNVNAINVRRTTRELTPPKQVCVLPTAPVVLTRRRGRPRKARSVQSEETFVRSGHMHEQNHDSSSMREQPNVNTINLRRTTRIITPPKELYAPLTAPAVPTGRRGRSRKARFVQSENTSYHQEGQKAKSKKKRIDSCVDKPPANTMHSSMSRDHAVEQANSPTISGYCGMEDPRSSNHPSNNLDSTNLQQVDQNHPALVDPNTILISSEPDENLTIILNSIKNKYGDITRNCVLESHYMKAFLLLGISKVVRDLQNIHFKDIDMNTLDSCYAAVRDAENLKVDMQWLHNRLDEIKDAIKLRDEAKAAVTERNRFMENVVEKEKKLEHLKVERKRLESDFQELQDRLDREIVTVDQLNRTIDVQESKFSRFEQFSSLMDGLI